MWLMTKLGFFSVVEHRDDPSVLLVRARCEADIKNAASATGCEWWTDENADYPHRMMCDRERWASTVAKITNDIDYDNFKSSVTDERHLSAYHRVWIDMLYIDDRIVSDEETFGDML